MLTSPDLEFIMEAHNGLSARIVQEAGMYVQNKMAHKTDQQTFSITNLPTRKVDINGTYLLIRN